MRFRSHARVACIGVVFAVCTSVVAVSGSALPTALSG